MRGMRRAKTASGGSEEAARDTAWPRTGDLEDGAPPPQTAPQTGAATGGDDDFDGVEDAAVGGQKRTDQRTYADTLWRFLDHFERA